MLFETRWSVSFKGIHGHDNAINFLMRAIERDRVSCAYAFLGPSGIGKAMVAVRFAKALNCLGISGEIPCDACPSCRKIEAANHPDVRVVRPGEDSSSIGIDEAREVIKDIALKPYEARKKAYIIDGADKMTDEAQAALLKTLEEPTPDTVIILVAENAEGLLPTVLSRAEIVRFLPLKRSDVKDILVKDHGVDIARAHILSGLSSGRLGEAIKLDKDEKFFERRTRVIDGLIEGNFFDTDFGEKMSRDALKADLDIMLAWFRDILITKALDGDVSGLVNIDRKKAIAREAARLDFEYLDKVIREIMAADSHLDVNANAKLTMSVLGMEINEVTTCTK